MKVFALLLQGFFCWKEIKINFSKWIKEAHAHHPAIENKKQISSCFSVMFKLI